MSNSTIGSDSKNYWITYAVFGAFAVCYFWYYLPQDFSYTDEGYLLGLGHRMALGQLIYVDFNFLRPPLSPSIQALFIKTFGSGYTVLWSKIYWAIQATATVLIASCIYREWMTRPFFTITLIATLLYSTLLFAFPWYTCDGMFFASLFALSFFRGRLFLAGVFAGLAFLCKQGFLALIPLTFAFLLITTLLEGSDWKSQIRNLMRSALGWWTPMAICSIAFLMYGAFDEMLANVFTLPQRVNPTSVSFVLFQDLPAVATKFAAPALLVLAIYLVRRLVAVRLVMILALGISLGDTILSSKYELPQFMIVALYLVLLVALVQNLIRQWRSKDGEPSIKKHTLALASGVALLYVASINYSGVVFSYVGGVVALPMFFVVLSNSSMPFNLASQNETPSRAGLFIKMELIPYIAAFGVLTLCFLVHQKFPYSWGPRSDLNSEFVTPKLAGIRSHYSIVSTIDSLVDYVVTQTLDQDSIYVFPGLTSLCYLTNRSAWGRTHWSYYLEYDDIIADITIEKLGSAPPALIVMEKADSVKLATKSLRRQRISNTIVANFALVDSVGSFLIYKPRAEDMDDNINGADETEK